MSEHDELDVRGRRPERSDENDRDEPAAAPPSAAPAMRLDDVLKFFGVASTGGHAKHLIQSGEVRVNGAVETRRKRRIVDGDRLAVGDEAFVVELVPAPEE